jgi:hypothetical protein
MNSAFIVEVALKFCLTLLQDTTPLTNIKIDPDVDLHESTQTIKSESN